MGYEIGDFVLGTVEQIRPYALFMSFDNGVKGLLHISEISDDYIRDIELFGSVGDVIKVKVIEIDPYNGFLRVSYKQVPDSEKYSTHDNSKKKIPQFDEADFSALQEKIPEWIEITLKKARHKMIKVDVSNVISEEEIAKYQPKVAKINKMIDEATGLGSDFLGWKDWPVNYDKEELERLIKDAKYVRDNFEVLVVCGIGGSYLGARCALDALKGLKSNDKLEVIFMGQTFSPNYTKQVLDYLENKKFAINVISKSGTTTETSIAFRLLKDLLERKVGKEASRKAIFAVTDKEKGALKTLCNNEGYATYVLPGNIGGRFSVLTPVGLFSLAAAGIDVKAMLEGAREARSEFDNDDLKNNICYRYAVSRDYMYRNGKAVEMFVTYEPQMSQLSEWLKQLFGESEGKEKKGLLPGSVTFSTDLHSLGQFLQDGSPVLFETIINVLNPELDVEIPHDDLDLDGLNYLEGKKLSFVNQMAYQGTLKAHQEDGGVHCNVITIDRMNAKTLGYLFYFFMRCCAMSAYLLEINPFNQPGVEIYKKNMFHLLGKKGY